MMNDLLGLMIRVCVDFWFLLYYIHNLEYSYPRVNIE